MKEIKVGDWGWFWGDDPEFAIFGKLTKIDSLNPKFREGELECWLENFSHEHPTGKFIIAENPNTVSNDPYAELKKAFEEGKWIQTKTDNTGEWVDGFKKCCTIMPSWNCPLEYYRIKPEPQYRPYTWEDREEFRGRWVRFKPNHKIECVIIQISDDDVFIEGEGLISYENALSRYEYIDGTPFGKLLTPSEDISNTN